MTPAERSRYARADEDEYLLTAIAQQVGRLADDLRALATSCAEIRATLPALATREDVRALVTDHEARRHNGVASAAQGPAAVDYGRLGRSVGLAVGAALAGAVAAAAALLGG